MISQTSMTGKRPSSSLRYHDGYRPSKIHRNRLFLGGADEPAALRKGKWSLEEEALAEQMIRDFFNHNLLDCQEGASLRSYLADKLSSSKMRISKKFAHRNIGSVSDIFTCGLSESSVFTSLHILTYSYIYRQSMAAAWVLAQLESRAPTPTPTRLLSTRGPRGRSHLHLAKALRSRSPVSSPPSPTRMRHIPKRVEATVA